MKKTTRTAFWYQLNDLIEKIRLYKARFQSQSPSKTNKSIGKKLKKSFKRGFCTNKTLQTFRGPQNNNEFDSPDKTGFKFNEEEEFFKSLSPIKSMKNIDILNSNATDEFSGILMTPKPKDFVKIPIQRKSSMRVKYLSASKIKGFKLAQNENEINSIVLPAVENKDDLNEVKSESNEPEEL